MVAGLPRHNNGKFGTELKEKNTTYGPGKVNIPDDQ